MITLLRLALAAAGLVLLALRGAAVMGSAALHGGLPDQLLVLATLPWGIAGLGEWLLGAVLAAGVIFWRERGLRGLLLGAPVFLLGQGWTALWLAWRLSQRRT